MREFQDPDAHLRRLPKPAPSSQTEELPDSHRVGYFGWPIAGVEDHAFAALIDVAIAAVVPVCLYIALGPDSPLTHSWHQTGLASLLFTYWYPRLLLIGCVVWLANQIVFGLLYGGSLGKLALGMRIKWSCSYEFPREPGFRGMIRTPSWQRFVLRAFVGLIDVPLTCFVGGMASCITSRRFASIADRVCSTVVIMKAGINEQKHMRPRKAAHYVAFWRQFGVETSRGRLLDERGWR